MDFIGLCTQSKIYRRFRIRTTIFTSLQFLVLTGVSIMCRNTEVCSQFSKLQLKGKHFLICYSTIRKQRQNSMKSKKCYQKRKRRRFPKQVLIPTVQDLLDQQVGVPRLTKNPRLESRKCSIILVRKLIRELALYIREATLKLKQLKNLKTRSRSIPWCFAQRKKVKKHGIDIKSRTPD